MTAITSEAVPSVRSTVVEKAFWPAVVILFLVAAALRMPTWDSPWIGAHSAWGGAFYGNIARNFVRYGFAATDFAPVVNTGVVDPALFEVYYHHPVFSMWVTGLSFHAFGVHEWSARLAPLVFSLLTLALVFVFAHKAYGRLTALFALGFLAVIPVDAYYATHLDPYGSMAIFFTALAVEAYRRWLASGTGRHYTLMAIAIVLGCLTSWYTYFIVPPIVAHWWFTQRSHAARERWIAVGLLPVYATLVFAFFMVHRHVALSDTRPEVFGALTNRFLLRTVELPVARGEILRTYLTHIWTLFTVPFVALMAGWLILFVRDLVKRRLRTADWCLAILLSYGLLYGIVFPGHLPAHDYFVRAYAPGVALASAVVLTRLMLAAARTPVPALPALVAATVLAITGAFGILQTRALYAAENRAHGLALRGVGNVVAAVVAPDQPVLLPTRDDKVLAYYVDRPMLFDIDTPAKLDSALASTRGPYVFMVQERNASRFPELLAHLRTRHPERREESFILFTGNDSTR